VKPLLLGLSLLLASVLTLQWRGWAPDVGLPAPPSAPVDAVDGAAGGTADVDPMALEPPPKEAYASVTERPLFLPDRRPPPDEPEDLPVVEDEPLPELDGVDLTAVVITPAVVSAWVRSADANEVKRLRLGEDYQGWTVKTIEPSRLVLERQGETNELPLRDYANAPPRIPPTRLPPSQRAGNNSPAQPAAARRGTGESEAKGAGSQHQPDKPARQPRRRPVRNTNTQPRRQPPRRAPSS
jgi:general secretion pathway protein N